MLDIRIRSSEADYRGFVEVVDLETNQHYLHKPFRQEGVEAVLALDAERVVCLSENSKISILNGRTGKHLKSRDLSEEFPAGFRTKDLVHLKNSPTIALMESYALLILNEEDLSTVLLADSAVWDGAIGALKSLRDLPEQEKARMDLRHTQPAEPLPTNQPFLERLRFSEFIRERDDGKLIAGSYDDELEAKHSFLHPGDPARWYGTYTIDLHNRSIVRTDIDKCYGYAKHNVFFSVSPDGKWGLRRNFKHLRHHKSAPVLGLGRRVFGRRKNGRHPDLADDGVDRFLVSFELWDLENGLFVMNLEVAWLPQENEVRVQDWIEVGKLLSDLEKPFYHHKSDLTQPPKGTFARYFDDVWDEFTKFNWLWQSTWEKSGDAYWLTHRKGLRRIGVDGSVSPLVRFDVELCKESGEENRNSFWRYRLAEVTANEDEFVVRDEHCVLHVPRELVFQKTSEVWVSEAEAKKTVLCRNTGELSTRDTLHLTAHIVEISELSEQGAKKALKHLTNEVAARFNDLLGGTRYSSSFELAFQTVQQTLQEDEFFDLAIKHGWDLREETTHLLTTWLDKLEDKDRDSSCYTAIWAGGDQEHECSCGALGQVLKYLVLTDKNCLEVFRTYLSRRDGEHEVFSADVLGRLYIDTYGFSSPDIYRFGIYWVAIRYRDGRGPVENLWNELGLLDAASSHMLPIVFADLVFEEFAVFNAKWSWSNQSIGEVLEGLKRLLPGNGDWADRLLEEINSREFDGSRREYVSPLKKAS